MSAVFFARGLEPVICGVHAINGVGLNVHQTWALRRADVRAIAESPFRLPDGSRASMAHIRALAPDLCGASRLLILLDQALGGWMQWSVGRIRRGRLAIALALAERFSEGAAIQRFAKERAQLEDAVGKRLAALGVEASLAVHAYGHAGSAYSIQWAAQLIAEGAAELALVVGADSYYDPDVVDLLVEWGRIYDGRRIEGFIPGEGAAMVAISTARFARENGLASLASIEATSVGQERTHSFVGPNLGEGLAATVCAVTDRLAEARRSIDWWLGDLSTESYRIRELQLALPRFTARVSSSASRLEQLPEHFGDLGAATIPTGVAIATEAFVRGDPDAANCLLWASSDGPARGAVLLGNPRRERVDA